MAVHTAPNPHADWARTRSGALPENTTMDTPKSPTLAIRQLKRPDLVAQEIKRLITEKNLSPGDRLPRESERSEEHTSELQSPCNLVCRLLLEKKKITTNNIS